MWSFAVASWSRSPRGASVVPTAVRRVVRRPRIRVSWSRREGCMTGFFPVLVMGPAASLHLPHLDVHPCLSAPPVKGGHRDRVIVGAV